MNNLVIKAHYGEHIRLRVYFKADGESKIKDLKLNII